MFAAIVALFVAAPEPPMLEARTFKDAAGTVLPYRLLTPAKVEQGQKYPLVLFLHGAGERGTDNAKQLAHGVAEFASRREAYPCYLIAPQCPDGKKWVEVDWFADSHVQPKEAAVSLAAALALVEHAVKDWPVDPKRVYITGISMGGYGTWDSIARKPELFAAAIPICGGGDEATAERMKAIPIWAFHGSKDSVVKPARSQNMIAALKKAGATPKYTEYPNEAHLSWVPAYRDPELYKWLFQQTKP